MLRVTRTAWVHDKVVYTRIALMQGIFRRIAVVFALRQVLCEYLVS